VLFVHVDCDDLWVYRQDYGLAAVEGASIYADALPRLLELLERHGARATLFVVGADLARRRVRQVLREAVERGHAIANHTQDHRGDFGICEPHQRARQVALADDSIRAALDVSPVGFRGSAYCFDSAVRDVLVERGYRYDSSHYPGLTLKLMTLAMRAKGATKKLGGPAHERWDLPHWHGQGAAPGRLVEVPILTLTRARLPVHTTALFAFGPHYSRGAVSLLGVRAPHGVFLLHAVDGLDPAAAPELGLLPTLKRPLEWRLGVIERVLETARTHGEIATTEATLA
jgi:peptidoglycan/xylan/chitin deacetylase (PgdA/CDA1 family)